MKLVYFAGFQGRSEPIRAFAAACHFALEFEGIDPPTWPTRKQTTPFGTLPYAIIPEADNLALGQSGAIITYIAESTNHNGKNAAQKALIHQVEGVLQDIYHGWTYADLGDGAGKREGIQSKAEKLLAALADRLPGGVEKEGKFVWAVGSDDFTAADAKIWGEVRRLSFLFEGLAIPAKLQLIAVEFENLPGVKEHVASVMPKEFIPRFFLQGNDYLARRVTALTGGL